MGIKIATDGVYELSDRAMSVIARDVGMQILPLAFDLVGVGAVGWQEVQADPRETGQGELKDPALVNDAVVEDDVDGAGPIGTDLGIEVDVDLIGIDDDFARRWVRGETAQLSQAALAARGFPGAGHHLAAWSNPCLRAWPAGLSGHSHVAHGDPPPWSFRGLRGGLDWQTPLA